MNRKAIRNFILLSALILLFFFIYWFKSQAGINFSESFSLSEYRPFKYFKKNKVISIGKSGIIFDDSFDSWGLFDSWSISWMKEKGKVSKDYDKRGNGNSRCLLIRSSSMKNWVCSYYGLIKVQRGDRFSFKGSVGLKGNKNAAYAGVAAFDRDQKAIQWNYIQEKIGKAGLWSDFGWSFSISDDNIKFIRFRLSGIGIGEFRFDNICLRKENKG